MADDAVTMWIDVAGQNGGLPFCGALACQPTSTNYAAHTIEYHNGVPPTTSGPMYLLGGMSYPFRLQYYNAGGAKTLTVTMAYGPTTSQCSVGGGLESFTGSYPTDSDCFVGLDSYGYFDYHPSGTTTSSGTITTITTSLSMDTYYPNTPSGF